MAKSKKMKVYRFYEPVFRIHIWFAFSPDVDRLWEFLNDVDPDMQSSNIVADGVYRHHYDNGAPVSIICLRDWGKLPLVMANLSHEVNHLVMRELPLRGIYYCEDTRETYAYLTGYITGLLVETYLEEGGQAKK